MNAHMSDELAGFLEALVAVFALLCGRFVARGRRALVNVHVLLQVVRALERLITYLQTELNTN